MSIFGGVDFKTERSPEARRICDLDTKTLRFRDAPHFFFDVTNIFWTSGNAQKSLGTSRSPAFSLDVLSDW